MTFGIPDPGKASKAVEIVAAGASPFDVIRNVTLEGREYWSARDLMPLLGYEKWERFADAISRAKIAAHNSGYDVAQNFPAAGKVSTSGPAAQDYHLSRYACYLVAMSGDSRKEAVARALTYFAIKTREAEVTETENHDSRIVIPQTYAEALRAAADQAERAELAESKVRELAGPASSWNELAEAAGDYSVADAAKVLSRDANISTGERRLFASMQAFGWIFRRDGRWRAYQSRIERGWLTEKVGKPYVRNGEMCVGDPTVRITPKGLAALHQCLGGSGQIALMAVSE